MAKKTKICKELLSGIYHFLENERYIGQTGKPGDMAFITDDSWLKDTAVIDAINSSRGGWDVCLVFAHYKNPLQLIVRSITRCFSEQKAIAAAFYIRKEASKDVRGTLRVSINDLTLCIN